jgi:hypothetical protein
MLGLGLLGIVTVGIIIVALTGTFILIGRHERDRDRRD